MDRNRITQIVDETDSLFVAEAGKFLLRACQLADDASDEAFFGQTPDELGVPAGAAVPLRAWIFVSALCEAELWYRIGTGIVCTVCGSVCGSFVCRPARPQKAGASDAAVCTMLCRLRCGGDGHSAGARRQKGNDSILYGQCAQLYGSRRESNGCAG